jgi:hypothetical protein
VCVFAVFLSEHPLLILVLINQDAFVHLALWRSKDVPVPAYLQPEHPVYRCQRHDAENPLSFPLVSLCQSSSCPLAAGCDVVSFDPVISAISSNNGGAKELKDLQQKAFVT